MQQASRFNLHSICIIVIIAPSRFRAFHLKCPAFCVYFELEKMRPRCALLSVKWNSDDSDGNQHPVLGKANVVCLPICDLVRALRRAHDKDIPVSRFECVSGLSLK